MEQLIKNSFCNYCQNKGNECLKIQVIEKNSIKIYKCVNYKKGDITPLNNFENYSRI